jgi:hypothetical protein
VRFAAKLDIELPADIVERAPTLWDACRTWVGARVDLATERVRNRMEGATFLHQVRSALAALGIDNARFLVVDGVMVFEDTHGQPHDLPDLMLAFADHVLLSNEGCRDLRVCVEHDEAGMNLEIEARAALEHASEEPGARVSVLGRVLDLGPRPDETSEAYRERIAPFATDPKRVAAIRLHFDTFVSRLERALEVALPGASVTTALHALGVDGDSMDRAPAAASRPAPPAPDHPPPASRAANTFSPPRNFSLSLEQRIGAAIAGPPPFAVRLRKIEDLHEALIDELAVAERESLDDVPVSIVRRLEALNHLIEEHNFAYPIERQLPIDAATGELLLGDEPWRPMAAVTLDDLRRAIASRRRGAAGH